jgi:hypothetical protein
LFWRWFTLKKLLEVAGCEETTSVEII